MRGKLMFLGGVAVGFVLGARAGRERYEEIVVNARKLWDHPTVQEAAGVMQAQANRLYHEGKDVVTDKLGNSKLGERMGSHQSTSPEKAGSKASPEKAGSKAERESVAGGKRPQGTTF